MPLEERKTVPYEWHTIICLSEVFSELGENNSDAGSFFTMTMQTQYLIVQIDGRLQHNDFFLLPYLNNKAHGQ